MILFHHSMLVERVKFGLIKPEPQYTEAWLKDSCNWLAHQVDFYPLFLAVGSREWQLRMTGYQDQFRRWLGTDTQRRRLYRKGGEFPNAALFSFDETTISNGVFIDECAWTVCILNAFLSRRPETIAEAETRLVFKRSLRRSDWLRIAKTGKHRGYTVGVNFIVPELDLTQSKRVWVRNQKTKETLTKMGFDNVIVKRLKVPRF